MQYCQVPVGQRLFKQLFVFKIYSLRGEALVRLLPFCIIMLRVYPLLRQAGSWVGYNTIVKVGVRRG